MNDIKPTGPDLGTPTLGTADDAENVKLSDYGPEDWIAFAMFSGSAQNTWQRIQGWFGRFR